MLRVDDVIELLKQMSNGRLVRSPAWVRRYFAPEYKRKSGRGLYWFEYEALAWLNEQGRERWEGRNAGAD